MTPFRVAITSGDQDGIGPEVTAKALWETGPRPGTVYCLWRSPAMPQSLLRKIDQNFERHTVGSWAAAQALQKVSSRVLIDICSSKPPALWVESMGRAGMRGEIDGLVTGPLSKSGIVAAGLKDIGHTEILARVTKTSEVFMTFIGQKFHVVLLTGHHPVTHATSMITKPRLKTCLALADDLRSQLSLKRSRKPLGLVGVNPHSGEEGLIGKTEQDIVWPVLRKLRKKGYALSDPLVPDVAFQEKYWGHYSLYIASYHDQGLIPFKMVHSQSGGFQMSLGLPFVRTSVDHGTGKDLFGKNKANAASMVCALDGANRLIRSQKLRW